jgi:pyruvate dehydrogenase kinase 2/3/4
LDSEQATEKALKDIGDLQRLHEDTFHLVYGLMQETSSVLSRFNDADRHLCFSTFEQVRSRHASTVETLTDIVISLRQFQLVNEDMDNVVDTFLRGRLGVQLLFDHYVSLHKQKPNGGVSVDCLLTDVIDDAVTEAKHMCDAHFENIPQVLVDVESDARITLIRPWIHHALVELLKNAMAASFETLSSNNNNGVRLPPSIHLQMDECEEFVSLSVLDQGVGLANPRAAFDFASSSVDSRWDRLEEQQSYAMVRSPLQSLGVGLPLSRMLLQHFGGDLKVYNREKNELNSGCTATLLLSKNEDVLERLPCQWRLERF